MEGCGSTVQYSLYHSSTLTHTHTSDSFGKTNESVAQVMGEAESKRENDLSITDNVINGIQISFTFSLRR